MIRYLYWVLMESRVKAEHRVQAEHPAANWPKVWLAATSEAVGSRHPSQVMPAYGAPPRHLKPSVIRSRSRHRRRHADLTITGTGRPSASFFGLSAGRRQGFAVKECSCSQGHWRATAVLVGVRSVIKTKTRSQY